MEALWVGIAFVSGLAARAFRLPSLVGFLAAGLVLSIAGVSQSETLTKIGHLGVLFLLFTVGTHLRVRDIFQREILGVGGLHLIVSTVLFVGVGLVLDLPLGTALLLAASLGFSSTVLAAKSLEDCRALDALYGRLAIGILILQDLVAVGLIALAGAGAPPLWALLIPLIAFLRPLLIRLLVLSGRDELMLLYGLILALGGALLFEQAGLSSELGALVAGVLLADHERAEELSDKLWGLKEVFLVGFFLQVGLYGLPDLKGIAIVVLLLALLPLKGVLFFALLIRFRQRARTAFMTAITLTAYSEFTLIVGAAAAWAGLFPTSIVPMLALLVAASYALNAPLSAMSNALWERFEASLARFEREVSHPGEQPRMLGRAGYLIVGMGRVGAAAYDYLAAQDARPLGLDVDPARIDNHLQEGRRVIFGDAQDPELWSELSLDEVEGILLAIPHTEAKVRAIRLLREQGYAGPLSALTLREEDHETLIDAGATSVCVPLAEAGRELAKSAAGVR